MFVSALWVIMSWAMAVLLLANSLIILLNVFDLPATGIRHLISFVAAAGIVIGLIFIMMGVSRYLNLLRGR